MGLLARHLPARAAFLIVGPLRNRGCGMEEVLECAFRDLPATLAKVVRFLAVLTGIAAVMIGGAAVAGIRAGRRTDRNGLGLLALAAALAIPPLWLLIGLVL